ncbi:MAG: alpha-amylase [Pseudobacteriovorax sp.]|nr:alpha-amylase [Pseudobacteriovorax sp.]
MKSQCAALMILCFNLVFICARQTAYADDGKRWTKSPVIYEVNVRQFTKEGSFRAAATHLERLKNLGVDILWLMPIHPIGKEKRKGTLGSPYSVKDYYQVNPEFGTMEDFKAFVKKAHGLGLSVILDWVPNHSAWDNKLIKSHPQWYTKSLTGSIIHPPDTDWTDVADFNYDDKGLWKYMIDAMRFWVETTHIDGFRCDVAWGVPASFWTEAIGQLRKIKKLYFLAEADDHSLIASGFDSYYGFRYYSITEAIAQGHKDADDLRSYLRKEMTNLTTKNLQRVLRYTSNHDLNSWEGHTIERLGKASHSFAVLSFVLPGTPLILGGQEAGLRRRLAFFEKDPMEWKDVSEQRFYQGLITLRQRFKGLHTKDKPATFQWLDSNRNKDVLAFSLTKDQVTRLGFFNLSPKATQIKLKPHSYKGTYRPVLEAHGESLKLNGDHDIINLGPWGYQVIHKGP